MGYGMTLRTEYRTGKQQPRQAGALLTKSYEQLQRMAAGRIGRLEQLVQKAGSK
jgi:hypothetical protein